MRTQLRAGVESFFSSGSIRLNDEPWVACLISHSVSGQEDAFRDGVRARAMETHVFPLSSENIWIESNNGRSIAGMDGTTGASRIDCIQNGLLLRTDLHLDFDNYLYSINAVDSYKVTSFSPDLFGADGRTLDPTNGASRA
ncbi:hypothetical protein VTO42DRAFT_2506 [Malbranchea cinnamomea]